MTLSPDLDSLYAAQSPRPSPHFVSPYFCLYDSLYVTLLRQMPSTMITGLFDKRPAPPIARSRLPGPRNFRIVHLHMYELFAGSFSSKAWRTTAFIYLSPLGRIYYDKGVGRLYQRRAARAVPSP